MSDNFKKKAARGIVRAIKWQVTKDPNDKSNESIDTCELIALLKKKVTIAEIWECPLESLGDVLQPFGIVHQGVVVTMENGKRYVIHKLPGEKDGEGDVMVSEAAKMGKCWSFVERKDIETAKLDNYLEKCGDEYNGFNDNCLHAVKRMWSLK